MGLEVAGGDSTLLETSSSTEEDSRLESLPTPLPLASPERSSLDEEQFKLATSYLRNELSVPPHLIPTYGEASIQGILGQRRAQLGHNSQKNMWAKNRKASLDDFGEDYVYEYIDTGNEIQNQDDKRFKRRPDDTAVQYVDLDDKRFKRRPDTNYQTLLRLNDLDEVEETGNINMDIQNPEDKRFKRRPDENFNEIVYMDYESFTRKKPVKPYFSSNSGRKRQKKRNKRRKPGNSFRSGLIPNVRQRGPGPAFSKNQPKQFQINKQSQIPRPILEAPGFLSRVATQIKDTLNYAIYGDIGRNQRVRGGLRPKKGNQGRPLRNSPKTIYRTEYIEEGLPVYVEYEDYNPHWVPTVMEKQDRISESTAPNSEEGQAKMPGSSKSWSRGKSSIAVFQDPRKSFPNKNKKRKYLRDMPENRRVETDSYPEKHTQNEPGFNVYDAVRKPKSKPQESILEKKDDFDGLSMDFWQEGDLKEKPNYKQRWNDVQKNYDNYLDDSKKTVIADRRDNVQLTETKKDNIKDDKMKNHRTSKNGVFMSDMLWGELKDDWVKIGDQKKRKLKTRKKKKLKNPTKRKWKGDMTASKSENKMKVFEEKDYTANVNEIDVLAKGEPKQNFIRQSSHAVYTPSPTIRQPTTQMLRIGQQGYRPDKKPTKVFKSSPEDNPNHRVEPPSYDSQMILTMKVNVSEKQGNTKEKEESDSDVDKNTDGHHRVFHDEDLVNNDEKIVSSKKEPKTLHALTFSKGSLTKY